MFKIGLILILSFCAGESFKILVVFGFPGKSHVILGNELVKLLLDDGHEVTYITVGKFNSPRENLSLIDISDVDTFGDNKHLSIESIMNNNKNLNLKLKSKIMSTQRISKCWNASIQHSKVQDFLMDTSQQFDAVIVSWLYSELASGFAAVYQCPLIWFSSMEPDWFVLRLIDGIPNPAYSIDFVTENVPPFTFLQRLEQLWVFIYTYSHNKIVMSPQEEESYRKAFSLAAETRGVILPNLEKQKFNGSLMLGNSNPVISGDISLPQNYKHIGGYLIDEQPKLLPENLQKILNESKHGFIYFSMGTRVNTQQMPKTIKKDLIHMFGNLSYTVLWKFDEDQPTLPPNVYIVKWAPQQSVLAHPNIKLFITHGGLQSMIEAVHFSVPIIGIPGFADQKLNIQRASEKGFCIRVDLSYDLAANLKLAIEEILGKANYKKAVERLSRIYHDKLVPPRKEISFWVRHVIENQNAQYLRSAALMVPWYQKIFLDIALVMLFGLIFITFMLRLLWNIGFGKNKEKLKLQ